MWLLVIEVLGVVAFPLTYFLLKRLPDRGATLSKVLGLLITSYLLWVLGLTDLVSYSRITVIVVVLVIAVVSAILLWRQLGEIRDFLWRERFHLLTAEAVFIAIFLMWAAVVAQVPAINHTEKPMDFGFLNALLLSQGFPPEDVWLSGNPVTYYHFGHLAMSGLTKLTGISSSVAYNLSVALVPALLAVASYGLVYNLVRLSGAARRRAILFGLAAPVLIGLISNLVGVLDFVQARGWGSDGFWQWVAIKDLTGSGVEGSSFFPQQFNWWWHSTRVINTFADGQSLDFTITEFPFFSFLLGDLHAHVMALPFMILSLSMSFNLMLSKEPPGLGWLRRNPFEAFAIALSLGALAFINTWDIPVFGTLLVVVLFILAFKHWGADFKRVALRALVVAVPILVVAVLLFLPFYLNLQSQASGILPLRDVSTRPFYFILIWAFFLFITVSMLIRQLWSLPKLGKSGDNILALTLALTFLPVILWTFIVLPLEVIEEGRLPALAMVGSRLLKLLPLGLIVGLSTFSALARARHGPSPLVFCLALTGLGFYLLMGAELFYVQDFLPVRMNTVFKLYYQAWMLLAVASAFGLYYWVSRPEPKLAPLRLGNYAWTGVVVLLLVVSLYYPAGAALDRAKSSSASPTLDGLAFVKERDAHEYDAIVELRDRAPRGNIVEAVGRSYSDHGRIAASTGLPSPLNWPGHEIQWRGSGQLLSSREEDVAAIYQSDNQEKVRGLLDKYDIRYVYLGSRERARYGPLDEEKFLLHMKVFFQSGSVVVYERIAPS